MPASCHKTDKLPPIHNEVIEDMKNMMQGYVEDKMTYGAVVAKFYTLIHHYKAGYGTEQLMLF